MESCAEIWTARVETHTAAELFALRSSWFQVSWHSPLHLHLHRGRDAGLPAPFVACLEPRLTGGRGGRLTPLALASSPS